MRSGFVTSALAVVRITDLVTEDEVGRGFREGISKRWPDSKVSYLVTCRRCVSVWAALIAVSGVVPRPVLSALALSEASILIDRQDERIGAIVSAQVRKARS